MQQREAPEAKAAETVSESKAPEVAPQAEAEVQPKPQAERETAAPSRSSRKNLRRRESRLPTRQDRLRHARGRNSARRRRIRLDARPSRGRTTMARTGRVAIRSVRRGTPYNSQNNRNGYNAGGRPPFNRDKDSEGNDARHRSKTDAKPRAAFSASGRRTEA